MEAPRRPKPAYTLVDLQKLLTFSERLPPGITVKSAGTKDFSYLSPGMPQAIGVTTDPEFYVDDQSCNIEDAVWEVEDTVKAASVP